MPPAKTKQFSPVILSPSLNFLFSFSSSFLPFRSHDGVFCSFEFLKKKKREEQCGYTCTSTLEFKDAINSRESTFPFFF